MNELAKNTVTQDHLKIKQLENRIEDIQFQVNDVRTMRDNTRANARIDLLEQQLSELGVKIGEVENKLNAYAKDDKHIEVFTDDEFKLLYSNSGLGAKDVASLLKANEKYKDMDLSAPAISKIVNGERGTIELRSYLGKQFRFAITKRKDI